MTVEKTVVVSGGFDPLHIGHLYLIKLASNLGRVVVIVDSDEYVGSKHKLMMPQHERVAIISGLRDVSAVVSGTTADGDCSDLIRMLSPNIFLVGPDKKAEDLPERTMCRQLGVDIHVAKELTKNHSSRDYAKPCYNNPPVCCSVIVYDGDTHVLVGKRRDNGKWDLPGGFLEPGENLEMCARREFHEETGANLVHPLYFHSSLARYKDGREVVLVVFHSSFQGTIAPSGELSEFDWVRMVPDNMNNSKDAFALGLFLKGVR